MSENSVIDLTSLLHVTCMRAGSARAKSFRINLSKESVSSALTCTELPVAKRHVHKVGGDGNGSISCALNSMRYCSSLQGEVTAVIGKRAVLCYPAPQHAVGLNSAVFVALSLSIIHTLLLTSTGGMLLNQQHLSVNHLAVLP